MDLDTHFRYEGLVTALPDPEQSQVARDLRREHLKALGDNATLKQTNVAFQDLTARLEQDLEDERQAHAKQVTETSHERVNAVANLAEELDAAQTAQRDLQVQAERLSARIQEATEDKKQAEERVETLSHEVRVHFHCLY